MKIYEVQFGITIYTATLLKWMC